jgi:hypothetical protein
MKSHVFFFALLSVTVIVASAPAQAQNGTLTRSFVSSAGIDSNSCMITAPCATFAEAYTKISANGIIAALDPGKYGAIAIAGPVTINGNGWAAITAPAQGNGITVNAGTGNVILTGLEVAGAGAAYNGIVFESGTSLTISNCIVKDFVQGGVGAVGTTGNGIWVTPTSGTIDFAVVNTIAVNNAYAGIGYSQSSGNAMATGTIDHVVANNNGIYGIDVVLLNSATGAASISISNSVASNNSGGSGIDVLGPSYTVTVDNDQVSNNYYGVHVNQSTVLLSRSVISNNSNYGIGNVGGTVDTYGDNRIKANGNSNAVQGTALTSVTAQ